MKTTTGNTLRGLALAGTLALMSAGQTAQAVFIFDVVDADTFTITASGSTMSLSGSSSLRWGNHSGSTDGTGTSTGSFGATPSPQMQYNISHSTGALTSLEVGHSFASLVMPDGGVVTVNGLTGVDLEALTLPSNPLPLTQNNGVTLTGTDNSLVFTAVPEPSSTAILALGGCAMLLRRRRA